MKLLLLFFLILHPLNAREIKISFVMAALGDSISTGFDSYHVFSDREGSWSTGSKNYPDFESHKMKLEKLLQRPVEAYNVAIPNSKSSSLKKQVRRLLNKAPKLDYVTLLIGANDACSWKKDYQKDVEGYKNNINLAVSKIIQANPEVKILLVPVPNMNRLYELGKDNKRCRKIWSLIPLCDPLFDKKLTDADRENFGDRIFDINSKLKEVSESYPKNAFYYDFLADINFDEEHVSRIDCFHPSAYGQKMISEFTFNRDLFLDKMPPEKTIVGQIK